MIIAWFAVIAVTVMVYLPGMRAGFYFDDQPNIVEASGLHMTGLSVDSLKSAIFGAHVKNRPISNLSLAFNHLASGLNPAAYHWTNLFIHLAAGGAVAWLILLLGAGQTAALAGAALFLVHPLNIQAVTYTVQRMTSLAALFFLLSLAAYIKARNSADRSGRNRLFAASAASLAVSLGCKENAVVMPLVVAAYEACFKREDWRILKDYRRYYGVAALVFIAAIAVALFASPLQVSWSERFFGRDYTGYQRVLTEFRAQWFYLLLLMWPAPSMLNIDHDFRLSTSLTEPWTTPVAVLMLLAAMVMAVRLAIKRPRYGFPLIAYFVLHLLESGPVNLELVFEHRMYLPMAMVAAVAGVALAESRKRKPAMLLALAVFIALAGATWQRNLTWADPVMFHYDTAVKSPNKFRPWFNYGTELAVRERYAEAGEAFRHALELKPADSATHNQLGNIYLVTGRPDDALVHYRKAVEFDQRNAEAWFNLAREFDARGMAQDAANSYGRFIETAPPYLGEQRKMAEYRLKALKL
ncbi:MAG: tetratricopeptide repeat protein [Nitrospirae bacterium]|nr:tetratricopeptide repeat protein [Nitrospirota bacterium]